MALFDDVFEGNLGTALVAALGVAILAPVALPALRSAAKLAIKGGLIAYDYGREAVAGIGEMAGDLAAEARSEVGGAMRTSQQSTTQSG